MDDYLHRPVVPSDKLAHYLNLALAAVGQEPTAQAIESPGVTYTDLAAVEAHGFTLHEDRIKGRTLRPEGLVAVWVVNAPVILQGHGGDPSYPDIAEIGTYDSPWEAVRTVALELGRDAIERAIEDEGMREWAEEIAQEKGADRL